MSDKCQGVECYQCGRLSTTLSYRSRCLKCETWRADANAAENDGLRERLAAAEADAERLLAAARKFSAETREARKKYASVMTFAMICAMDQLEKVVAEIDAARGGE